VYRNLLRPLLFLFDEEFGHKLIIKLLRLFYVLPGARLLVRGLIGRDCAQLPVEVMGLKFPNPVGLAAGLDKDATCVRAFADMGFGCVETGTVTPERQTGNPRKRLYRLKDQRAIINRMGFPSVGVKRFVRNLQRHTIGGIVGINIGKNRTTPLKQAKEDYLTAMRAVYPYADYIAVNVSSPNTPHLRDLQKGAALEALLVALKDEQIMQTKTRRHYVPLAVKIAPDIDDDAISAIATLVTKHKIDAVIATNSTVQRPGIEDQLLASEGGGLSGQPLKALSTEVIRKLYHHLKGQVPIIGVGGVETAADAWEKMVAGADLIQVYTAFIYEGPAVARRIIRGLHRQVRAAGFTSLQEAVNKARTGVHLMR